MMETLAYLHHALQYEAVTPRKRRKPTTQRDDQNKLAPSPSKPEVYSAFHYV